MKKIVLSVLVILLAIGYFSGTVSASNLYQVKVTPKVFGVDNLINNMDAKWDIVIDNSGGNLLISGDRIYIEFPSGFDLTYARFVSLTPITASGISASGSGVVASGTQMIIPVTSNQTSLGSFKISIEGVHNPATPSGTYMVRVWTTTSTGITLDGPTYSNPFLVVSSSYSYTPPYYPPTYPYVSTVVITPQYVNLSVGASQLFTAQAYDSYGNPMYGVTYVWSVLPGTGNGTITSNGYFTLTSPGTVTIKCEVLGYGIVGYAYVNSYYPYPYPPYYPYYVNKVEITPVSVNMTPGNTRVFTAQAYDSYGYPLNVTNYVWTVTPVSAGSFYVSPDTKTLTFTLSSFSGVVTISCRVDGSGIVGYAYINAYTPSYADTIVITPHDAYVSLSNPIQTFTAAGYDSAGNNLSGVTYTWSLNPVSAGTLSVNPTDTSQATFTLNPAFSGTAVVSCTTSYGTPSKTIYGSSYIHTSYSPPYPPYPPASQLVITPQTTIMSIGETKSFTAQAYDSYGNPIYGVSYVWTVISGNGYITPTGSSKTIYFTLSSGTSATLKCEVPSLGYVAYAYINTYFPPSPPVSGVTVSPYPPKAGYTASYFISFNLSPSTSLSTGDWIMITFPVGTSLPSTISPSNITINSVPLTSYPIIYLSSRSIMLYTPTPIVSGGRVDISFSYFCNIRNPSTPGTYTLSVSTSKSPTPVMSNPYTINP